MGHRAGASLTLIILLGGLLVPSMLHAQVPAAQGQFCATYNDDDTPEDCSFETLEMCQESVSGIGGYCAPQSLAPAMPPPPLLKPYSFSSPYAFAPTVVPQPPIDPAAGPLPLPDTLPNGN